MALRRIELRDFVIVRNLSLEMKNGFTALTGETGTGKSILIDAVQMALGARSDVGVVREGAVRTEVSVTFDELSPEVESILKFFGFDSNEPELLLRRVIDQQGKSRGWINGSSATNQQLKQLGELLIDTYSQHAWHGLTRADSIRTIFDGYAQISLSNIKQAWNSWQESSTKLKSALQQQGDLKNQRERLLWQIQELEKLSPESNEWDELNQKYQRLSNAQALLESAQNCADILQNNEVNVAFSLSQALHSLSSFQAIEPSFKQNSLVLQEAQSQIQDVARDLRSYLNRIEQEPEKLSRIQERISLWLSLAKQFRQKPEDLPLVLDNWREELTQLDESSDLELLTTQVEKSLAAYKKEETLLSIKRYGSQSKLSHEVTQAMQDLGLLGGRFEVELKALEEPSSHGMESVNFLFSAHASSSLKPLAKIASGGELSRVALAIAVCTSQGSGAATLIFDEVDTGIGGQTAHTVGKMMRQLGGNRQVLVVTHLPQVAACAHHHLKVSKALSSDSVLSKVMVIDGQDRVHEIARMISGKSMSAATIAHALELMQVNS